MNNTYIERIFSRFNTGKRKANSKVINVKGVEKITFIIALGKIEGTPLIKVKQWNKSYNIDELIGNIILDINEFDSGKLVVIEMSPIREFMQLVVDRKHGSPIKGSAIDAGIAIKQYKSSTEKIENLSPKKEILSYVF